MALALDELGVSHGERVAIVSPNAARFQIAFFGVSGYGRVLVPINYRLNADEIGYIVGHSGASVLLVDPESDKALQEVTPKHPIVLDGQDHAALVGGAPGVEAGAVGPAPPRRERGAGGPGAGRATSVVAGAPPPSETIGRVQAGRGWGPLQICGVTGTAPLLPISRRPAEWDGLDPA